jgi:hypothetical protein
LFRNWWNGPRYGLLNKSFRVTSDFMFRGVHHDPIEAILDQKLPK